MMAETKRKSVQETLKELGAETMPLKPGKGFKEEMRKMPRTPDMDLREDMQKMPLKLKKGGSANFIQKAIKKPGALRKSLGAKKGEPIPAKKLAAAAKKPGKMGQRARLAQTLKGLRK